MPHGFQVEVFRICFNFLLRIRTIHLSLLLVYVYVIVPSDSQSFASFSAEIGSEEVGSDRRESRSRAVSFARLARRHGIPESRGPRQELPLSGSLVGRSKRMCWKLSLQKGDLISVG